MYVWGFWKGSEFWFYKIYYKCIFLSFFGGNMEKIYGFLCDVRDYYKILFILIINF